MCGKNRKLGIKIRTTTGLYLENNFRKIKNLKCIDTWNCAIFAFVGSPHNPVERTKEDQVLLASSAVLLTSSSRLNGINLPSIQDLPDITKT